MIEDAATHAGPRLGLADPGRWPARCRRRGAARRAHGLPRPRAGAARAIRHAARPGRGDRARARPRTVPTVATGTALLALRAWRGGSCPGSWTPPTHAAARFTDHAGYVAGVLRGSAPARRRRRGRRRRGGVAVRPGVGDARGGLSRCCARCPRVRCARCTPGASATTWPGRRSARRRSPRSSR